MVCRGSLRGISISGKNKIAMTELKKALESNDYSNVKKYLNSGNVILNSDNSKEDIDKVEEYDNIIFWSFDLNHYKRSNWWQRTATEPVKDWITIRTANTMRKLAELS